jgi:DNA-directed RNA polymerase specialized sigma24 family protein
MNTTRTPGFPATRWTVVMQVCQEGDSQTREEALAMLCRDYWLPLYAFSRRSGHSRHDAEDLTQGFFGYLLERDLFSAADPDLGRLRTFLLTAFQRYMGDVRERGRALKRGGGQIHVPLDVDAAERQFAEPAERLTPEEFYDQHWALSVLQGTLDELSAAETTSGRAPQFLVLEPFLNPASDSTADYPAAASLLGIRETAARKAVSRLRQRFRETLRSRIAATLHDPTPEQIDEELLALKAALNF